MGDRFFPNEMPDFVSETTVPGGTTKASLTNLLYLPYTTLSDKLKISALDLKETVFSLRDSYLAYWIFSFYLHFMYKISRITHIEFKSCYLTVFSTLGML